MKTIGLIGGMSWESSMVYYQLLNQKVRAQLGGHHSAKCILYSVEFAEIELLQRNDDWAAMDKIMAKSALKLEQAGADIIVLCTNTMHLCSPAIRSSITVPFLHIATAAGSSINQAGFSKIGLLGTKFTMEKDFYKKVLEGEFGIETIIPQSDERDEIHRIVYEELVHGKFTEPARAYHSEVINKLVERGAQGIILGCTEIPILMKNMQMSVPLFDTTAIHVDKTLEWALSDKNE